jgi:hypothetical protein
MRAIMIGSPGGSLGFTIKRHPLSLTKDILRDGLLRRMLTRSLLAPSSREHGPDRPSPGL